jgi:hypothetical protein
LGVRDQEDSGLKPWQIAFKTLSGKNPTQNMAGGVPQVVEHLLSKCYFIYYRILKTK